MRQSAGWTQQDRRTAAGLAGGSVLCVVLAAGTGTRALAVVAAGLVLSAMLLVRRVVQDQPYASWIAWAASAVAALLLAWASPMARVLALPGAGISALVAVLLAARWRARRPH
ncbi:hypothetical protein M1P56_35690 (plasmid) [Streptomyces sp. HU2014]|uniref:hypothetical protein n=1 Tax=Streptomyces sp. HU2014 TaxID=2939414 RepID=UPI00200DCEB3|nr:hypothetical protein [Streptomyces sp. HU2014]UQI49835.1 hypothetical protein M1P56_35690 [Streptomyces sp. HU2014]